MKNRLTLIWLSCLTVFVSYSVNDNYRVLRSVEYGQNCTLQYMEKSAAILSKIKRSELVLRETPVSHPLTLEK